MKQTARIISIYTGDTSGVCSALFELGGMTVMHDPSGCNSTYSTHDEPRWYDFDSQIFISALTETQAILGDDEKLISDVEAAAEDLHPRFITVCGSPIPMMTGVDFPAVARQIEQRTGIPSIGISTDGMHSYISGVSSAFAALAQNFCRADLPRDSELSVNILGVTPLDFSINGTDRDMKTLLEEHHIRVQSVWAMGSGWEEILDAGKAQVNLVVSSCGLETAKILHKRFGTPYVIGTPYSRAFAQKIVTALQVAANTGENSFVCAPCANQEIVILGESVTSLSLANAIREQFGFGATVLCPLEGSEDLLSEGCIFARDEDEILPHLENARILIADPMYRPICPPSTKFIPLPHEAFSGRIYRAEIPRLVQDCEVFLQQLL